MADGTYFTNKYHFQDPQMADLARQIASIINGGIGSINLTTLATSSLTGKYCKTKTYNNFLLDEDVFGIWYSPDTISLTKIFLSIGELADADITVEIYKNDVATGQIATLTSGAVSEMNTLGTALDFLETDKISLKIKSCGSDDAPGSDLEVDFYYEI